MNFNMNGKWFLENEIKTYSNNIIQNFELWTHFVDYETKKMDE